MEGCGKHNIPWCRRSKEGIGACPACTAMDVQTLLRLKVNKWFKFVKGWKTRFQIPSDHDPHARAGHSFASVVSFFSFTTYHHGPWAVTDRFIHNRHEFKFGRRPRHANSD